MDDVVDDDVFGSVVVVVVVVCWRWCMVCLLVWMVDGRNAKIRSIPEEDNWGYREKTDTQDSDDGWMDLGK